MLRILLDQNVPRKLLNLLGEHSIFTARRLGWAELTNGDLIQAAEDAGFDILVTADRNLRYQQNWTERRLCLIVLNTNNWLVIRRNIDLICAAIDMAEPGGWQEVACHP